MIEEILVPLASFSLIFGIIYVIFSTRHRERMALIDKGLGGDFFKQEKSTTFSFNSLKTGLFLLGLAIGVFVGNLLANYTSLNEVSCYFSMILFFGGLSLVVYYFIAKKTEK